MAAAPRRVPPYFRVDWEIADAVALQALQRGDATEDQQKRALHWITRHAAAINNLTFYPGEQDASAFAEGRRFVGLRIDELLRASIPLLLKQEEERRAKREAEAHRLDPLTKLVR